MPANLRSGVSVTGLRDLQRALKRAEGSVGKDLRKELRLIANVVRDQAKANAPVGHGTRLRTGQSTDKSGRRRESDGRFSADGGGAPGTLKRSIRTSVNQGSVSVYSDVVYAYVQDRGGRVGRHGATLLERSEVSAYMTRAVRQTQTTVTARLDGVLDDLAHNFQE